MLEALIPSDGIQYPIPLDKNLPPPLPATPTPSYISRQHPTSTKTHFPPLKAEQDGGGNTPPLLFPLVPTSAKPSRRSLKTFEDLRAARLEGSKGKQELQETLQDDNSGGYKEYPNRDSWSYWTGAKRRNGHPNKKPQYPEPLQHSQAIDGQPEMSLEKNNASEVSHADSIGCGHSQSHLRQVTEDKQDSLAGSPVSPLGAGPSSSFPAPLVSAVYPQQQGDGTEYLHPQNGPNRRSYSLQLSSHPPIRLSQPTSPSEYNRRVSSLAKRFKVAGSSCPLHRVGSALSSDAVEPSVKSPRRRPASTTRMKEYKEFLLSPLSGREATGNLYQQPAATGHGLKPLLLCNTYQPLASKSTSRHYSASSFSSSHSTNFSYPRVYSDFPGPKRRNTICGTMGNRTGYQIGSVIPLSNNGEYSFDKSRSYSGISRIRSLSEGSIKDISRDFHARSTSLHPEWTIERAQTLGGMKTDKHTLNNQKESGKARPNFFIPDQPIISPVRSGSYRSVIAPRDRIDSTNFGIPTTRSISWRSSGMGIDGEVYDNILAANNCTRYVYCDTQTPPVEDRRRVDDISFTSTIEAASRPYTPDNFVTEGVTHNDGTVTRSVKSRMSIYQHRGRQSAGSTRSLGLSTISRSSSADRNALVRQKGTYSEWPYTEKVKGKLREDILSLSPESVSATVGQGILGAFKKRKKVAKEIKDTTKHPHTATTRAGPINIEEEQSPPLRPDVYQFNSMQAQLNYLAKDGKAKYEYVAWDIRDLLVRENARNRESGRQSKIDTLGQLSCPPAGKNTINSKYTKGEHSKNDAPGDTSQPGTLGNSLTPYVPQIMGPDTIRVVSPTSPDGFLYISTTYAESQDIAAKAPRNGLGSSFRKFKIKRDNQRSQGEETKAYMKGARTESLTILEKLGRKVGINNPIPGWRRKSKNSMEAGRKPEQNATVADDTEKGPLGIGFGGTVDILESTEEYVKPKGFGNPYGFCEPDWGCSSPGAIWKEFEQGPLVDPVKEKLEAKSSHKLWSSKKEVKVETSVWARLRKLTNRKSGGPGPLKVIDVKGKGKALV